LSLVDQISTLPEVLSRLGFTTAAVVSTGLFSGSNMSQGFDVFEEPSRAELQGRRDQVLVAEEEPLPYRPAEQTLAVALDVLAELRDAERSFLWIHLYDPHLPYVQRREEQALLGSSPSVDGESFRRLVEGLHHASLDDEELAWVLAYDAEVLYMDQELGAFFARAGEHEVDDYLTVIVGDHGEGLGSHDWWDHGKHVYEEQRKVPLLVRWPAHRHVGRVDAVVEILDIMPTILWAVGAQPDALADRALPVEGLPLQWLLEGRLGAEAFSAALVQRRTYTRPNPLGILRSRLADRFGMERQFNQFEEGERFVLVRNDSAYVHSTVHEDELFDLRIDPGETDNRCCTGSGLEKQLRAELLSVLADLSRFPAPGERIVDPDTLKQLRALGYIQ
jgi:arylsulfatase A-like enzyme